MSHPENEEHVGLRPEVRWNLTRRLPSMLFAVTIAGIGGFCGGLMMSWGPRYLSIHVTDAHREVEPSSTPAVSEDPILALVAPVEQETGTEVLPYGAEARLLAHSKNTTYLLLGETAKPEWGTGKKQVRGDDFRFSLTRNMASEFMTPKMALWRDRELTLYGPHGYVCSAKVAEFQLLQQTAEDTDDARDVGREWYEDPQLVARLESVRGSCSDAVWARDASLPAPALGRVSKTNKKMRNLATREFRASAAWKKFQADYEGEGGTGKWDVLSEQGPMVRSLKGPTEELIFVGADIEGCGDFGGRMNALFRVQTDGTLVEIDSGEVLLTGMSIAADFDLDGDLDFIGQGGDLDTALVKQGESLSEEARSRVFINYCGC